MVPAMTSLTGFSGETIWPLGQLRLLVTIGDAEHFTKAWMNFVIMRSLSPYNGIIGRPGIREIQAVPSTAHGMLKFPVDGGIVTIRSTILIPTECATPSDMTGVPRSVAEHRLNIREGYLPVRPKKMGQAPERAKAIQAEPWSILLYKNAFRPQERWRHIPALVDKAFDNQVGRNIEVYVDDLVIKSHTETEMLRDMDETFRTLQKINMKLNPKKCMFGAVEGKFLGYIISPEGIKPFPNKTEAVLRLLSPWTIKEVQSLNGKLASLNRFLSKSAKNSLPLFKTLKKCIKKSDFHWTPEAEQAFKQLKQHLSELPMLVAPKPKEELIVYLFAFHGAISAVLMTKRGTVQMPVYFISRALQGLELNYTPMEKLVLALVFGAKRLRRYFQAHYIAVITNQPIKQIISRLDIAGRLQKWSIMLGEHNITYRPRTFVKGQILADFLVERPDEAPPDTSVGETPEVAKVVEEDGPTWMTPLMEYLKDGTLPDDRKEARKLHIKARHMHARQRSVVAKAMRLGYYWPTMYRDTRDMIRKCKDCQIHRPVPRNPQQPLTSITAPRPFYKWGIDIAGPFPERPGKAHRTMIKSSHGDTYFSLTYGTEAVIPAKVRMPTYRTAVVDAVHNDEELRLNLDLLEERREHAAICKANAKLKMTKWEKLGPKWEGPYEVTEALRDGAYMLRSMDGTVLPRTWNIANLKKCYL
ncbi:reverse transcriptase domain-containing protein [Tanacetum coccineum]